MKKKFLGNFFFVLILNVLVKPIWLFGIDVAVQNRVGVEEYGFYYPIFSFSILLNILLDLGITNYNNRNIAQHEHLLGRYFSGIFNVKLMLGVVYMLITLMAGYLIGYESRAFYFLFLLGVNQFLASLILYLRSNLSGLHLFKLDGLVSVSDRVLMILICSYLLWSDSTGPNFKIEWFLYAQFAAYLFTAFISFIIVLSKAKMYKPKFDWILFRVIIKQSLPFALLVILMSFYYRLDSVMIDRLLEDGAYQAGVYAQSYRILEGFNMFGYIVAALLLPIFSRMIKKKEPISRLVYAGFSLVFIPSSLAVIISLFKPAELMGLLYDNSVIESAEVFSVLMLSFLCIALTYIFGTLLTANGSLSILNKIAFVGLIINFFVNYTLIPIYGAYGAAVATLMTQLVVILSQLFFVNKIFEISPNFRLIAKQLAIVAILFVTAFMMHQYSLNLLEFILIVSFIALSLIFIFKILSVSVIKEIFKSNSLI
jgi:O-antigen/teichoic acid export membrane protein